MVALASSSLLSFLLHVAVRRRWKYAVNRKWYAAQNGVRYLQWCGSTTVERGGASSSNQDQNQSQKIPSFVPYPAGLVFPGLQLIIVSVFLAGVAGNAVTVLASTEATSCESVVCSCQVLANIALLITLAYMLLAIRMLLRFNIHYRAATWRSSESVARPSMVKDPFMRALSKLRTRIYCLRRLVGHRSEAAVDRSRGKFVRPRDEILEPTRTERLLARPYALFQHNASDVMDAYGFALMARASGTSSASTSFEVALLSAQLLISMLNGLGVGYQLQPSSPAALIQVAAILAVQLSFSLWVFCVSASNDRLTTLSTGIQFGLEAWQTTLLLLHTLFLHPELETASFAFAVASLCAPIMQLAYDSLTQIIWAFRDGFSFRTACQNCVSLVLYLPRMILFSLGVQVESGADAFVEHAGDDLNRAKERSYDDFADQAEHASASSADIVAHEEELSDDYALDDYALSSSESSQDDRHEAGRQEKTRAARASDAVETLDVVYLHNRPQTSLQVPTPLTRQMPLSLARERELTGARRPRSISIADSSERLAAFLRTHTRLAQEQEAQRAALGTGDAGTVCATAAGPRTTSLTTDTRGAGTHDPTAMPASFSWLRNAEQASEAVDTQLDAAEMHLAPAAVSSAPLSVQGRRSTRAKSFERLARATSFEYLTRRASFRRSARAASFEHRRRAQVTFTRSPAESQPSTGCQPSAEETRSTGAIDAFLPPADIDVRVAPPFV